MKFVASKRLLAIAGCAAALMAAAAPSAASADVVWTVTGNFNDGGSLSGFFDINVYGFLSGFNLQTTTGSTDTAFDYNPSNSYYSNGTFYVDAEPSYQSDLHLQFVNSLSVASANNPIQGGQGGHSWECQGSFSCFLPSGGAIRYLTDGHASAGAVPEPAAWTMMIVGFGGIGAVLRRRRTAAVAIA